MKCIIGNKEIQEKKIDEIFPDAAEDIKKEIGNKDSGSLNFKNNGNEQIIGYTKMTSGWYMVAIPTMKEIYAPRNSLIRTIILISIIALVLTVILGYAIGKRISIPVIRVTGNLSQIAQGDADLTQRIETHSTDETGILSKNFNKFIQKLQNIIIRLRKGSDSMSILGEEVTANMEETSAAVHEINANIQSTEAQITNQASAVTETSSTIEEMARAIENLNTSIEKQTKSLSQSSVSIEEMVSNIQSVNANSEQAQNYMDKLNKASDEGKAKLTNMNNIITEIDKQSKTLLEANSIISAIAEKTNLLAMNAAIEAAHAGESGKGFAVVADEIRKLAEQSTQQSKSVENNLKLILDSISNVVTSSQEVDSSFDNVFEVMQFVNNIVNEIKHAMEEQSDGSKQILNALNEIQKITESVKTGASEMQQGNEQILESVSNLNSLTSEVKRSINEIANGTNEINGAITNINNLTIQNQKNINDVHENIGSFIVGKYEKEDNPLKQVEGNNFNDPLTKEAEENELPKELLD